MSNVYVKDRTETRLDVLMTAKELQIEITKFVMSEKSMPKKYRIILGSALIEKSDEMVDNIIAANTIYPKDEETLKLRKRYQLNAIINCFQLQNKLIRIIECIQETSVQKLNHIIPLIEKLSTLLKAWKNSTILLCEK